MLIIAATNADADVASSPGPAGFVVLAALLVAIVGLLALGARQRRSAAGGLTDLGWLPPEE